MLHGPYCLAYPARLESLPVKSAFWFPAALSAARVVPRSLTGPARVRAPSLLQLGKHNALLVLILALAIGVADLAGLIGTEEQNLAQPLVGVNLGR